VIRTLPFAVGRAASAEVTCSECTGRSTALSTGATCSCSVVWTGAGVVVVEVVVVVVVVVEVGGSVGAGVVVLDVVILWKAGRRVTLVDAVGVEAVVVIGGVVVGVLVVLTPGLLGVVRTDDFLVVTLDGGLLLVGGLTGRRVVVLTGLFMKAPDDDRNEGLPFGGANSSLLSSST
jgi:hypothetical protein